MRSLYHWLRAWTDEHDQPFKTFKKQSWLLCNSFVRSQQFTRLSGDSGWNYFGSASKCRLITSSDVTPAMFLGKIRCYGNLNSKTTVAKRYPVCSRSQQLAHRVELRCLPIASVAERTFWQQVAYRVVCEIVVSPCFVLISRASAKAKEVPHLA